ncbi:bifunctional methylenetetrahydrofolate dehydrogenase/methenyltetrahydrofolate cyclohydrolase FolD [Mammaliicoccus sciuri]|jgi:methylenetetrahydrofolate dehydrogenase (NADP+)/methenyltetrahydrofolate cyclohydrolase|uniref:bifunctional methylenetetrahydrofolate dehydrogenase/methenyltetrahydrofolate cyclohydrolase FolD n=1 Tax=Mammaliicoccus sciuri TaxID=1296 RepID=UPI00194F8A10|nr:bifunctional methylenetetrahydrofolate dehydrogenase/methenyltetrahydrofolate cyclohydrolase FolD [Mammaliicoccus sciuri]MBO1208952.1 bifunctional methylenetetrahydrofolate dehydrogenase/methenyltetrahydrofolate cyclohydrolase FolD [Mammaliicoccus sciuri]MCD5140315.1 bifunctional methylenetetrahydrofolate dehydrogenase/methenyltetrahydrofolate cyclohydrolase FolD [Mammaliicoccus sciuri]MCJ0933883.1 bifunctional methylenetetrahydrofolate dehydrogenase/methenyltetrahydrofolate cyclohydrolase Fo
MVAKILDGREIAKTYRAGLQAEVEKLKEHNIVPKLTVILVGNDGASQSYVNSKKKAAEKIGMISEIVHMDESSTEEEVLSELDRLNNDDSVSGILVQVPLPKQVSEAKVLEAINPDKDVDGFNPINIGRLYTGERTFIPCTPLGIMEILKHADIDLKGKNVAVIGRSHIVGQPVSKLLTDQDATVTLLHSKSTNTEEVLKQADVIVSAVGRVHLVTKDLVKPGAVIIDVGNTPDENGKLKGDVDLEAVKEVASAITPVPGGVGPLTITMVLNNTLLAEKWKNGLE